MNDTPASRPTLALLLLFGSVVPIAGALYSQYALGYPPCPLCLWQRYPYILPFVAGLLALLPRMRQARWLLLVGIAGWLVTGAIAAFHVGVEHGWWEGAEGCTAAILHGAGDIRERIMAAPLVACNEVSLRFVGFSMANWNMAAAFAFSLMAWRLYRRMR